MEIAVWWSIDRRKKLTSEFAKSYSGGARAHISWSSAISTLRHDHSGRMLGPRPSLLNLYSRKSIPGDYLVLGPTVIPEVVVVVIVVKTRPTAIPIGGLWSSILASLTKNTGINHPHFVPKTYCTLIRFHFLLTSYLYPRWETRPSLFHLNKIYLMK